MPETRLAKARATLPPGYQFGDARYEVVGPIDVRRWPPPPAPVHPTDVGLATTPTIEWFRRNGCPD